MNIFEQGNVVSILYPSDLQTAVAGDYIDMADYHAMDIVFFKGATDAGDDPDVYITQSTSNAGAGEKGLDVDHYYLKSGTLLSTSSIGGSFTKTTMTASYIVDLGAASAEVQQIVGFHITSDMLDSNNSFRYVRVHVPDTGTHAHLACILGIMYPARYAGETAQNPLD